MGRSLLVAVVLVALLGTGWGGALAQEATPPAAPPVASALGPLPTGVAAAPLAVEQVAALPDAPARLVLERIELAPGEAFRAAALPGPELLYVASGTPTVVNALGLEAPAAGGDAFLLAAGSAYGLRNDAAQQAAALRLRLVPAGPALPPPDAPPAASPAVGPDSVEPAVLLAAEVPTLPAAPALLFIERVTWAPGADLPEHTFAGPVGVLAQSGTLTVADPSGLEGRLGPGQGLVFPAGVPNRERNAEAEPATALLVGVAPTDAPLIVPLAPPAADTPTPTAAAPAPTPTPAGAANAYADPAGWRLTWEAPWTRVEVPAVDLALTNGVSLVTFTDAPLAFDVRACLQQVEGGFLLTAAGAARVDQGGDDATAYAIYAHADPVLGPVYTQLQCEVLVPGQAVLIATATLPQAQVEAQSAAVEALYERLEVPR